MKKISSPMKIFCLDTEGLAATLTVSPFQYSHFQDEQCRMTRDADYKDSPHGPEYLYVDAGIIDERPLAQWNRLGRSIWRLDNIRRTAQGVAEVLGVLGVDGFVVTRKYGPGVWFPPFKVPSVRVIAKSEFLRRCGHRIKKMEFLRRYGCKVNLEKWSGGFLLSGEPLAFIECFLDYSHLLFLPPVEMVCRNLPLMLGLDHDLYAYFVSSDRRLLNRVTQELARRKLLFGPSPYLPIPEGWEPGTAKS